MNNVNKSQLKKCIFMPIDEYKDLVLELTDGLQKAVYEIDGLYYEHTEKAEETETYHNENITETLSRHFDVNVTSVHADDCEYIGVWICYKDKNEE